MLLIADTHSGVRAYDAGHEDTKMSGVSLSARAVQSQHQDWSGEDVVCYLNGSADSLAGLEVIGRKAERKSIAYG